MIHCSILLFLKPIVNKTSLDMTQPDALLLQKIIDGNRSAFGTLYQFYRKPALRFCITLLKDEAEAENVLHEVFLKIWERKEQINPALNFNSYLFTCLRNYAFDHFKRMEKDRRLREQYLQQMTHQLPEESEDKHEQFQLLDEVVGNLSEKRQQVLLLNVYEGKSYQEIAELMHISKNTVKNQLVKARQILRDQFSVAFA
ncbi:DNA-directed RNA polymerase sigma-70 factor [Persicitalea jodogahamensis]|uniref:DNA-directed RNA polymerase sigma-70 factor n=2 Tax=Persicitalea jodogahamensis TaxID=402147 RepID=A0A8J3D1A5_9BACT|nr:DNA-directed RNA polymerase sigma-70 factor [Persicitalea jodogahamensis]